MFLGYVYKLRPNIHQSAKMDEWLNMLRSLYNWFLADRINGYHQTFIQGEYCDLRTKATCSPLTCALTKNTLLHNPWKKDGKHRSAGLMQDAYLVELKAARPWYKGICANTLQLLIKRLDEAYNNFFKNGKGFPKFKNKSTFRSFQYKPPDIKIEGNKVYLPSIGWMRFFNSRTIPDGFSIRTVTIRKKQDGWYMSVRIEDKSVPEFPQVAIEEVKTAVGLDLGITKLVHCSDGSQVDNLKFLTNKKTQHLLKIRQRRVSRKKKGSKNRAKTAQIVGRLHQRIADKRNSYQWQVANKIVKKADAVIVEDLNISGMRARCKPKKDENGNYVKNGQSAKSGLNRAIGDASWGDLTLKIEYMAAKSGKIVLKVNPQYTSQKCSACGHVDKSNRDREKFICTKCGHLDHADLQAARNIKAKGIEQYGLVIKKVRRDSSEPKQLTLFETPTSELTEGKRKQHAARNSKRRVPGNLSKQLDLFSQDISGVS